MKNHPYEIQFTKTGQPSEGYIAISELEKCLPFEVKRCFWTYYTPESIVRGRHAHYRTEQVLVAVAGRIILHTENPEGTIQSFILDKPDVGVYLPPNCWHTMQYSHNAVQLVFASTLYDENDYIRSYEAFKNPSS
jgi:hypothetical protein